MPWHPFCARSLSAFGLVGPAVGPATGLGPSVGVEGGGGPGFGVGFGTGPGAGFGPGPSAGPGTGPGAGSVLARALDSEPGLVLEADLGQALASGLARPPEVDLAPVA